MTPEALDTLAAALRAHPSIRGKCAIAQATADLGIGFSSLGRPGDDAAILPRAGGGFDLLAGEGFMPRFVAQDPWFAGWCGIMVNLSDIAAMGGRASAAIDQIWAPCAEAARPLLDGLRAAAQAYDVPIVGGHTNFSGTELGLAVTMLGRAERLITSFDAAPGEVIVSVLDDSGAYRGPFDNFCAALTLPPARLRAQLALLPRLCEEGLVAAGKDISQGGIAGTALMLAEASGVGIALDLDRITPPHGVSMERWLRSFPSFGFLLSVKPERAETLIAHCRDLGIAGAVIGRVDATRAVRLTSGSASAPFWDWGKAPYLCATPRETADA